MCESVKATATATAIGRVGPGHEVWIEPLYPERFTVFVPRPPAGADAEESDEWYDARCTLVVGVMGIFNQLERCGYSRRLIERITSDLARGTYDHLFEDDDEPDEAEWPEATPEVSTDPEEA